MARLVEILAKEMDVWPAGAKNMTQDNDGGVSPCTDPNNDLSFNGSSWTSSDGFNMGINILGALDLADDHAISVVTRAQWKAERDRQKGGEWKRHRGGKQPVLNEVFVEYKLRDGVTGECRANQLDWFHDKSGHDVMQYKVISQPQAEEVEMIHSQESLKRAEIKLMKPSVLGAISDIPSEAKTDYFDGPLRWRDCVNELDAYIEEFTREREALINRLEAEGFALIQKINLNLDKIDATLDMSDWRNWKVGDMIAPANDEWADMTEGRPYAITYKGEDYVNLMDDRGDKRCIGAYHEDIEDGSALILEFKWHSRP